jgi:CubicO group peptidase (beta-lactamase class C family)
MRTVLSGSLAALLLLALPAAAHPPIASARVAFDRDGVTASQAQGLADVQAQRALSVEDPVRIASISKLVLAIGVMRLVEEGTFDLDTDVSTYLGWPLRHPRFADTPITLRLMLSHRSGLTDDAGYWATPLDGDIREILNDPRAWDTHAPGSWFRYTNLNSPLVASMMERATGERFDLLMQRLVLEPAKITACYGWESCDAATAARAVVLYDAAGEPAVDDNRGAKPECNVRRAANGSCDLALWQPGRNGGAFSPQGGLRISATALARVGRLLLGKGEIDGVRVLSPASVQTLLTPQWVYAPGNGQTWEDGEPEPPPGQPRATMCRYGLSTITLASGHPDCGDDPFGDGIVRVGHSGNAYGLRSGLWIDPASGTGVAYFATGMDGAPAGTHSAYTAEEERLATGR